MKLHQVWASVGLFALCTACGSVTEAAPAPELEFAPAPMGETAPVATPAIELQQETTLDSGTFVGDVWLEQPRMELRGSGIDETVLDGNLTVTDRCLVQNLTVTGDLIFAGNNARAIGVRCLGQVLDYGVCNRH
ncbi:MAG: hypothetical protein R3F29_14940 [Planctomycetota bacterium]